MKVIFLTVRVRFSFSQFVNKKNKCEPRDCLLSIDDYAVD